MSVKIAKISKFEKRCIGEQTGEECKNEGSAVCNRCSVFVGIPHNKAVKELMFR